MIRDLAVAAECVRVQLGHPFTLAYPVLVATLGVGLTVATLGYAGGALTVMPLRAVVTLLASPLVVLVCAVFLMVAYCYELHERFKGRRPLPFAGLAVAARRLPAVVGSAVIIGVVLVGRRLARAWPALDRGLGLITSASASAVAALVSPAIALGEGDAIAVVEDCHEAVTERCGPLPVASLGGLKLGAACVVLGLAGAVGVGLGTYLEALPGVGALREGLLLAGGVSAAGVFAAILVSTLVLGPASTAVYLYATEAGAGESSLLELEDLAERR